jgi:integrase/recombinase XerD
LSVDFVSILVQDFLNDYATSSAGTQNYWRDQVQRVFHGWLHARGILSPDQITPALLREYIAEQANPKREPKRLSQKSVRHRYLGMHRFLAWCVEQGHLTENPAAKVRPPKVDRTIRRGYTREELDRMMLYVAHPNARRNWIQLRNRAILVFLIGTGARADELLRLTLDDVRLKGRREDKQALLHGKGGKDRMMPLGQHLQAALSLYLDARPRVPHDAMWLTLYGDPLNYDAVRDMLLDLEQRCGVPEMQAHRFRHTYATEHYRKNRDLVGLQHALGHTEPETTIGYLRGLGVAFHQEARYPSPDEWLVA